MILSVWQNAQAQLFVAPCVAVDKVKCIADYISPHNEGYGCRKGFYYSLAFRRVKLAFIELVYAILLLMRWNKSCDIQYVLVQILFAKASKISWTLGNITFNSGVIKAYANRLLKKLLEQMKIIVPETYFS